MLQGWCCNMYLHGSCNCKKTKYDNDSCGFDIFNDTVEIGHCIRKVPQRQRWGHTVCAFRNERILRRRKKNKR